MWLIYNTKVPYKRDTECKYVTGSEKTRLPCTIVHVRVRVCVCVSSRSFQNDLDNNACIMQKVYYDKKFRIEQCKEL